MSLAHDGYVVAEQVVTPAQVAALIELARMQWGFDLDDPSTWGEWPRDYRPAVWGHQAQWDVRQHPPVHRAFAGAYGREDLWVSQDALAVKPPGSPGMAIHWDIPPAEDPGHLMLQGVLYLTDVPVERGPFVCVPTLFRDRDGWVERHTGEPTWGIDIEDHEIVLVTGRTGDLVIFDSRLPHGNAPNTDTVPRVVQYVTMFPPGARGMTAESQQDVWRTGRARPGERERPGWGDPEPWPPARLTALGRSLLGLSAD